MSQDRPLQVIPERLMFGAIHRGSLLCGSFQILGARSCQDCRATPQGNVPSWIELEEPVTTKFPSMLWRFVIRTDAPAILTTSLRFECDTGTAQLHLSLTVHDEPAVLGDLAFCSSPFNHQTEYLLLEPLVRMLQVIPIRLNCVESVARLSALRLRTVVFHQDGLLRYDPERDDLIRQLLANGTTIVVFSDEFYSGTTSVANKILRPFGMQMKQRLENEPGIAQAEKVRRRWEWRKKYESRSIWCGSSEIGTHELTTGVNRLSWPRPCTITCTSPDVIQLVRHPHYEDECLVAVSRDAGVVAVGTSLWTRLASVGWPYDNDRLLANLLVGGSAERQLTQAVVSG